jgi:hypothetical protein
MAGAAHAACTLIGVGMGTLSGADPGHERLRPADVVCVLIHDAPPETNRAIKPRARKAPPPGGANGYDPTTAARVSG